MSIKVEWGENTNWSLILSEIEVSITERQNNACILIVAQYNKEKLLFHLPKIFAPKER